MIAYFDWRGLFSRCQTCREISNSTFWANLNESLLSSFGIALLSIIVVPLLYFIIFACALKLMLLFLYLPALTGNGFACHVTPVTVCVMDGILVRALFCLRHAARQRHPATPANPPHPLLYLSHAATCSRHPALLKIFSPSFPVSMAPCCGSFICWHFALLCSYLSSCRVSVGCRWSIITFCAALWVFLSMYFASAWDNIFF